MKDALTKVVTSPNGTAHSLQIEGADIAAKTGTAELKANKVQQTALKMDFYLRLILKRRLRPRRHDRRGEKPRRQWTRRSKMKPVIASLQITL